MGSLPSGDTGVGSATNSAFMQIGGALEVAARAGGAMGAGLAHVAREAFASGMDLGLITGALVVLGGAIVAFIVLPRHRD